MKIGIIGGSALKQLESLQSPYREMVNTPYGAPSCPLTFGTIAGNEVVFIPRHGFGHTIPPHKVNYRANIYALKQLGVTHVIGVGAVGGISEKMAPLQLVIPDQIIDYTGSRKHTFQGNREDKVKHIDFTWPYDSFVREQLIVAAQQQALEHIPQGTYGVTQGPRLETAAEIQKLKRDGCDIVGMTGMPEAALARELDMRYACCALVVNWAAGVKDTPVTIAEIEQNIKLGMHSIQSLLMTVLPELKD